MRVCLGFRNLAPVYLERACSLGQKQCMTLGVLKAIFTIKFSFEDINFEPHLHNQDGVILIHRYFEICLRRQVLYAHKIWAHLDKQLLRYKT